MIFEIKICGITNVDDALAAVDAGADAIGLNFYRGSKRCVDVDEARQIVDAIGNRAEKIGVFVNQSADDIREICRDTGLHLIQLHGDEPPELLRLLNKDHDLIRARRLDERGLSAIVDDLQACSDLSGFFPDAILVDSAVSGQFGGTGLGLAIVKQLAQLMGGDVGITSTPGHGSTFWFTVQLGCAAPRDSSQSASDQFLSGMRVLIVDGNPANLFVLNAHLMSWGAETISADSGAPALGILTQYANAHTPIDLTILDIQLPDMDGLMLARAIKADPLLRRVDLLAHSSGESQAPEGTTDPLGFVAWLQKPVRQSRLRDCLRRYRQGYAAGTPAVAPKPRAPAAPGGRVLLVEDNPVNREVATGLLALLGYHVDSAEDGQQAIEVSAACAYDVILMDCQMPVMDGFTATAHLRERERQTQAARIPIIALTANAMEGDRDRCLASGMDDYLSKPFSQQSLSEILARWCWPRDQSHPKAHASRPNEKTDAGKGDTSHTPQSPSPAQINRDAWAAIATLQQPGQPNVLHNIIGLYLTSSQTQIDALRQALREQNHDAMMALAHTLKSASATLGAHRLAALANELEQACRTEHGERAEGLIPRIEIEHRDACVIFRTELEPSPKEAA